MLQLLVSLVTKNRALNIEGELWHVMIVQFVEKRYILSGVVQKIEDMMFDTLAGKYYENYMHYVS